MTCRYCQTVHPEGWTRCRKCDAALVAPELSTRPARRAAVAVAADPFGEPREEPPEPSQPVPRAAVQASLFSGRVGSKIVPIRGGAGGRAPAGRRAGRRTALSGPLPYQQQTLRLAEFPAGEAGRAPEGVVSCKARVAGFSHRVLAFSIDLAIVAMAAGLAMPVAFFWGGLRLTERPALIFFGAALGLVWILYQSLWCAANFDSAGPRWTRLRLLDFNGHPPRRRQRFIRLGVMCLGTMAAGLGQAWALVDEEGLTWQDHVSETFPTTD